MKDNDQRSFLEEQNKGFTSAVSNRDQNITNVKVKIKFFEKEVKKFKREFEDASIAGVRAGEDGDKASQEKFQAEAKAKKESLDLLVEKLKESKQELEDFDAKIDEHITKLAEQPGFKEHINEIMDKKFSRKLNKLQDEKDSILQIQTLVNEHPNFENNFIGMKAGKEELEKLESEKEEFTKLISERDDLLKNEMTDEQIKTLEAIEKQISSKGGEAGLTKIEDSIIQANDKISRNKSTVLSYCRNNDVNVNQEDIDLFLSKNFAKNKDGKYNFDKTFKNQLRGYDKQIDNYSIALDKLEITKPIMDPIQGQDQDTGEPVKKSLWERAKERFSSSKDGDTDMPGKEANESTALTEQPKWYQFIKKYKIRKATKEMEENNKEPETDKYAEEPTKPIFNTTKDDFKDSLKYDVVKEYLERAEEDVIAEAKETRKAAQNQNQEPLKNDDDGKDR